MSNVRCRVLIATLGLLPVLLLAACGSSAVDQVQVTDAQAGRAMPNAVATTAPLSLPTATFVPAPTSTVMPQITSTPVPLPTVAPTPTTESTPTVDVAPEPTATSTAEPVAPAEVIDTPTPVPTPLPSPTVLVTPTPTVEEPEGVEDDSVADPGSIATLVPETPIVVASGEPPLECYDKTVRVYRAFVEDVDALSFEGGRVYCAGAGTDAVSAEASYRHSSRLIVQRNPDYMFNNAGTAYIPYSGTVHFCRDGQPASAPIRADSVPALLVVIEAETQRQLAQGAVGPAMFTGAGTEC